MYARACAVGRACVSACVKANFNDSATDFVIVTQTTREKITEFKYSMNIHKLSVTGSMIMYTYKQRM